jgi:hypothetical protein
MLRHGNTFKSANELLLDRFQNNNGRATSFGDHIGGTTPFTAHTPATNHTLPDAGRFDAIDHQSGPTAAEPPDDRDRQFTGTGREWIGKFAVVAAKGCVTVYAALAFAGRPNQ